MANILCLETDQRYARRICDALRRAGHSCRQAESIGDALRIVQTGERMVTILSAKLPWKESYELLCELRAERWPVLFLTNSDASAEHLRAVYRSCCDVLSWPCSGRKLADAVAKLSETGENTLVCGGLQLSLNERLARRNGEDIPLTAQEFELLKVLMESPNKAVSREQLLRTAWGYQSMGETRTVDVHVQRLRRKIGADAIETVYRMGYRFSLA